MKIERASKFLTLAGTRHFDILHGTGEGGEGEGGSMRPPRDWLLSELELRLKNQRVACHETKPLTPEFKVLCQTVTSEARSIQTIFITFIRSFRKYHKYSKCEYLLRDVDN